MEKKISQLLGYTDNTKKIPSKKFPGIKYVPGEDVWVSDLCKNRGNPVSFDLSKELTIDDNAVQLAAEALDRLDETGARKYMKEIAEDPTRQGYDALCGYFDLCMAKTSVDTGQDGAHEIHCNGNNLASFIDQLTLDRLGSFIHKKLASPVFIMDFTFTGQQIEELLTVYFDANLRPFNLTLES